MPRSSRPKLPSGALLVQPAKDGSGYYWEVKWRVDGRQVKKRLGKAWVDERPEPLVGADGWQRRYRKRRGKPNPGFLTYEEAIVEQQQLIADQFASRGRVDRVLFEDAASAWLDDGERIKNWKPSTSENHHAALAMPGAEPKLRGRAPKARLMTAFAGIELASIETTQIRSFLASLDRDDSVGARSVNYYRDVLMHIFELALDRGWIVENPVIGAERRREPDPREFIVYTPAQINAIAAEADPLMEALIKTAAFTGLRQGELLELRRRDIRVDEKVIYLQRSYSASTVTSPKSRHARTVPLADQALEALTPLLTRDSLRGHNDLVFSVSGDHLNRSTVRRSYVAARDRACAADQSIPTGLKFHDLRHCFGSLLAEGGYDVVAIQAFMGHSTIRTTQRYLHARPRAGDAAQLTAAFDRAAA